MNSFILKVKTVINSGILNLNRYILNSFEFFFDESVL